MFNISPAKGFGNVATNTYARSLGGLPEQQAQYETMLASAVLKGLQLQKIAKAKAKAAKYQGQQAGNAAARSGLMDGIFSAVSGIASGIGANMGSFGGDSIGIGSTGVPGLEPNSYYGTGGRYGSFNPAGIPGFK